jgi:plastocyanin
VHTVEIREMVFRPETLTVARGDTVRWVNRDFVPHTATAEGKPAWDTGTLGQGDSGQVVVRVAGRQAYLCTLHPTMRGVIVVED